MGFQCFLDPLRFDADIPLGRRWRAVLQQPLNQGDVLPVVVVDTGGKKFSEGMGADLVIVRSQVVAYQGKVILDGAFRDRKDYIVCANFVFNTVALQISVEFYRHSKGSFLFGLLFDEIQPIPPAVPDDVAQCQFSGDVGDPHTKICFYNQRSGDSGVWPVIQKTIPNGLDNLCVLLSGERYRFLVHKITSIKLRIFVA